MNEEQITKTRRPTQREMGDIPYLLKQINDPPKKLYIVGSWPPHFADGRMVDEKTKYLCVVGARRHSTYGRDACKELVAGLRGYNICIVSGLALGIDALAHEAALEAGLPTIAFPGSGLSWSVVYPERNRQLAERIVEAGGCLISEFEADTSGAPWTFPKRNRLMAGISHATFVVEAARPSGTLITSGLAGQYNRDVFALPGSIFSALAEGPHMLINEGACIVRSSKDILHALGFEVKEIKENSLESETALSPQENILLGILNEPLQKNETLQKLINEHSIPTNEANALISMMELGGYIREEMGTLYRTKVDHGDT